MIGRHTFVPRLEGNRPISSPPPPPVADIPPRYYSSCFCYDSSSDFSSVAEADAWFPSVTPAMIICSPTVAVDFRRALQLSS